MNQSMVYFNQSINQSINQPINGLFRIAAKVWIYAFRYNKTNTKMI